MFNTKGPCRFVHVFVCDKENKHAGH